MIEELRCELLNTVICGLYRRSHRRFWSDTDVAAVQRNKLRELMNKNRGSAYGRRYDFAHINSVADYQDRAPLTVYEDYLPYIDRIMAGEQGVLTEEEVLLLEPTGGSVSGSKLIPYTAGLKAEMQKGLQPWIYDLYSSYPGVTRGRSYWSVTPATAGKSRTPGGIPIGFADDAEYFGKAGKYMLRLLFVAPADLAREQDIDRFYFRTALALLNCRTLSLISVWNPTFLLLLLEYIHTNVAKLLTALPSKRRALVARYLPDKRYDKLWPGLRVISCWRDANASSYAQQLRRLFPHSRIQPKGLLATECIVSFPLAGKKGAVLSFHSHFFEFRSLEDGNLYLAHQLRENIRYEVIVSTSGGLYRYELRDIIQVTGFTSGVPRLRFCGKNDTVCDLFGEKLHEVFVAQALKECGLRGEFALVAPETDRYVLYVHGGNPPDPGQLDTLLRKNFHYDYCRKLGQLKPPRIYSLTGNPRQEYFQRCMLRGQKLGDIKPMLLVSYGGWAQRFTGQFADEKTEEREERP